MQNRLWLHFQEDELREAAVPQTPRRRQSGDAAAHNDDRNGHGLGWWSKGGAVTESMARSRSTPPSATPGHTSRACSRVKSPVAAACGRRDSGVVMLIRAV